MGGCVGGWVDGWVQEAFAQVIKAARALARMNVPDEVEDAWSKGFASKLPSVMNAKKKFTSLIKVAALAKRL